VAPAAGSRNPPRLPSRASSSGLAYLRDPCLRREYADDYRAALRRRSARILADLYGPRRRPLPSARVPRSSARGTVGGPARAAPRSSCADLENRRRRSGLGTRSWPPIHRCDAPRRGSLRADRPRRNLLASSLSPTPADACLCPRAARLPGERVSSMRAARLILLRACACARLVARCWASRCRFVVSGPPSRSWRVLLTSGAPRFRAANATGATTPHGRWAPGPRRRPPPPSPTRLRLASTSATSLCEPSRGRAAADLMRA